MKHIITILSLIILTSCGNDDTIKDLQWNYEDASYKAPEENTQWFKTSHTLQKHIPNPKEDWEFNVLSIFSTKPVDEIKEFFKNQ